MNKIILFTICTLFAIDASVLVKTVKTSGDYPTLGACLHANEALTQDTLIVVIDTSFADTGFTVHSYADTKTIICTTTTSNRHIGLWGNTKYRIIGNDADCVISDNIQNITFKGIEYSLENITSNKECVWIKNAPATNYDIVFDGCIFRSVNAGVNDSRAVRQYFTGTSREGRVIITNSMIYDFSSSAIYVGDVGTYIVYNNTFYNNYGSSQNIGGAVLFKNNIIIAPAGGTGLIGTFLAGTDYTSSNLATIGGTITGSTNIHDRVSQKFDMVDSTANNFLLASTDTGAIDKGESLQSDTAYPFNYDIIGNVRSGSWDIGASEYGSGCTPATITRSANVTADLGDAGKIGHAITGTADSTTIVETNADSVAMLAKATKDTVAYRGKAKGRFYIALAQFSCASKDSAYCKDSLIVVGDSVKYANRTDTAYISGHFHPANAFAMSDSVTAKTALPTNYALTKTGADIGMITYTAPPDTQSATAVTLICWHNGFKVDSGSFNIEIIYGTVTIDSVSADTVAVGDTVTVYGRHFGIEVDSLSGTMGDSAITFLGCDNDTISMIIPDVDTGTYDLILGDGMTADTLTGAFYVEENIECVASEISYDPITTLICTVGIAIGNIDPTITGDVDSVTAVLTFPSGITLSKTGANKGRISGTAVSTMDAKEIEILSHNCSNFHGSYSITVSSVDTSTHPGTTKPKWGWFWGWRH